MMKRHSSCWARVRRLGDLGAMHWHQPNEGIRGPALNRWMSYQQPPQVLSFAGTTAGYLDSFTTHQAPASHSRRQCSTTTTNRENDDDQSQHRSATATAATATADDASNNDDSNNDNKEWIRPPPRRETTLETSQLHQQQLHYKQQERIDSIYDKEGDALFTLTEEELKTLSEEEILERVEQVLAMEEALEEQAFQLELEREEQLQKKNGIVPPFEDVATTSPDWLQTRRAALGKKTDSAEEETTVIPVLKHELLTVEEIKVLLESHGGSNLVMLPDDPDYPRMGGAHGMILCTAGNEDSFSAITTDSPFLINTLARILIEQLKERQLGDLGVLGAQMGTRHLTFRGTAMAQFSAQQTWHCVDCGNYIVHILDAPTRQALKLEELWSGKDPLWKLQYWDEDAVEDYCANHPVPANFNSSGSGGAGSYWDPSVVRRLERNQYTSLPTHRPVIANATKRRDRIAGRQQRRARRQQQWQQRQ